MVNFKKIDEKDFIFINKNITEKEEKEFSNFLKKRKKSFISSKQRIHKAKNIFDPIEYFKYMTEKIVEKMADMTIKEQIKFMKKIKDGEIKIA